MLPTIRKVILRQTSLLKKFREQISGHHGKGKTRFINPSRSFCDSKDKEDAPEKELEPLNRNDMFEVRGIDKLLSSVQEAGEAEFPSDLELYNRWKRKQSNEAYRPSVDPKTTSIVLFPGQGSQYVGMGKNLLAYPGVPELYQKASEILGYDLLNLCLYGPKSELDKTVHCQPAVFVTSIAAVEKLLEEKPWAIERCVGTAGFSLGEYTALVFGGAISFEDALEVIKLRAERMQQASEMVSSGMLSIYCHRDTNLSKAMTLAREYCKSRLNIAEPVCMVANYLSTQCKVVAGHTEALEFLKKYGREFGIRKTQQLSVSGAFHTQLMMEAKDDVRKALKRAKLQTPFLPVHNNVDCKKYQDPAHIIRMLGLQVYKPVKWEQTMHVLFSRKSGEDFPRTFEVGPANILGSLLKMTNSKAYSQYTHIEV